MTISRSSLSIKVIGSRSRACAKNDYSFISTCYSFVCAYNPLIRSRSSSNQGQDQIKVIFRERYSYVGALHLNQMRSCSPVQHHLNCGLQWGFLNVLLTGINVTFPYSKVFMSLWCYIDIAHKMKVMQT